MRGLDDEERRYLARCVYDPLDFWIDSDVDVDVSDRLLARGLLIEYERPMTPEEVAECGCEDVIAVLDISQRGRLALRADAATLGPKFGAV